MISNTCKYGIRSLVYLAHHAKTRQRIGIKQIAEELDIPSPFLGKILQMLTKSGYLKSYKGPHGGFEIGKDPFKVNLYEIVVLIDGSGLFTSCLVGIRKCEEDDKSHCAIHEDFADIRKQIRLLMEQKTIGDLAAGFDNPDLQLNF
jgi:Rrf2 family protein